eukprot:g33596.t1
MASSGSGDEIAASSVSMVEKTGARTQATSDWRQRSGGASDGEQVVGDQAPGSSLDVAVTGVSATLEVGPVTKTPGPVAETLADVKQCLEEQRR